ncbi:hypothetical protein DPMN_099966 [Dreissena polymorpha]|uniref:Uncharacterized protein n=1 Tax=Dreissena polymorpha TaxID=45954 RepID=A0A9D4LGG2_DREPO|nr:hypothetical protein DPMN_099966 [Dreissena polymorpha]
MWSLDHIKKNAPPLGSHVFQAKVTIFELIQDIIKTNLLTKFHENWTINVASRCAQFAHLRGETNVLSKFHENWAKNRKMPCPLVAMFFHRIPTIFKLVRDINKTNVLTNFHDDWAKIVTSRVLTRENCHYIHIEKNAPPTGDHVF